MKFFEVHCHGGQDVDPPLCFPKQSPVYGKDASGIIFQEEVQNLTVGRKNDDAFVGCTKAKF
jgi:hypothetical protein